MNIDRKNAEPYWYVDKEGKYYSSNEVKVFCDAKTRALYKDPPQWRLDKGDLIPLHLNPPRQWRGLTEEERSYFKACGFVGVTAVEETLRAKNSTLASIPAVPPG